MSRNKENQSAVAHKLNVETTRVLWQKKAKTGKNIELEMNILERNCKVAKIKDKLIEN